MRLCCSACSLLGVLLLILGMMSAEPASAGDYDMEYFQCVINCDKNPAPYSTSADCIAAECKKYQNVTCSSCNACKGGGLNNPCPDAGLNCNGAAAYCVNGLCVCWETFSPALGGKMYYCNCQRT